MKNLFITVRFDRMKNGDLMALYHQMMTYLETFDANLLDLSMAFGRFYQQEEHLQNLERKQRKLPQTPQIVALRKQNDKLVSAMLLHLKALKYAGFDDQRTDLSLSYDRTRKHFKDFVHLGQYSKDAKLNIYLRTLKNDGELYAAIENLGLMRYVQKIENVNLQIEKNTEKNKAEKKTRPAVGATIPSKEHVIDELRLFLRTIEIAAITHPDTDYTRIVQIINQLLTEERAQLRNLASRRKTAKAKAELKQQREATEKAEDMA